MSAESIARHECNDEELQLLRTAIRYARAGNPAQYRIVLPDVRRIAGPLLQLRSALGLGESVSVMPILADVVKRKRNFWFWSKPEWLETYRRMTPRRRRYSGSLIVPAAYLYGGFDLSADEHRIQATTLAWHVFGPEILDFEMGRVLTVAYRWGMSDSAVMVSNWRSTLSRLALTVRNPCLEELTLPVLKEFREREVRSTRARASKCLIVSLSKCLSELGIIAESFAPRGGEATTRSFSRTAEPINKWDHYVREWMKRSTMESKSCARTRIELAGRWVAANRPEDLDPANWTGETAAAFIDWIGTKARVGDYSSVPNRRNPTKGHYYKPRSRACLLANVRSFLRDLASWRLIRFTDLEPVIDLATPRAWMHAIGPAPRDIAMDRWVKLVHASLNLTDDDIAAFTRAPRTMVRAMAKLWTHAGLRSDEYSRLRTGCIRELGDLPDDERPGHLLRERVANLIVPVGKTAKERVHAIPRVVADSVLAWEAERPAQPRLLDRKTLESVELLWTHSGRAAGKKFWNQTLIPMLCKKAGVPVELDDRTRITSHRGRASVATWLHNTRDGMTLEELMLFLGHRDMRSTLSYVNITPIKKARSYARAHATSYLQTVLIDEGPFSLIEAAKGAAGKKYYPLEDGSLCGNPAWASCPHRFACARCSFWIPPEEASAILAMVGVRIKKYLEEMPLSDEEDAIVNGDLKVLARVRRRLASTPTPDQAERGAVSLRA